MMTERFSSLILGLKESSCPWKDSLYASFCLEAYYPIQRSACTVLKILGVGFLEVRCKDCEDLLERSNSIVYFLFRTSQRNQRSSLIELYGSGDTSTTHYEDES